MTQVVPYLCTPTIPPAGKNEGGIKQSLTLKYKTNRQYGKY
jgi:hypothetical protein